MNEKSISKDILSDLTLLIEKNEISAKDFENFVNLLKSEEVKNYLEALSKGSKAEQALRETFFTNNSKFAQYLFKDVFPEVNQEGGFLDYLIKADREEISLEIKPLYDGILIKEKAGKVFQKIKKRTLDPKDHKKQILKYLEGTREFVVLTNLEDWYFFSKSYSLDEECNYFGSAKLFDLLKDYKQVDDFWYYLDKKEDLSIREPLDKKFYESLRNWVNECSKVKFICDKKKKTELIINLINKFIFIQSLDKFWVISKDSILNDWQNTERKWISKEKLKFLQKFFEEINDFFFEYYDTELFIEVIEKKTILDYIDNNQSNINLFYEKLNLILGIDYGVTAKGWIPGIIQYNYRRIDEDILGKAYETFLAEIRKEQGIFYTPRFVTQYIVESAIGKGFNHLVEKLIENLKSEAYENCFPLLEKLFSIKILDPACGSGSFLIKSLKYIWKQYLKILKILEENYKNLSKYVDSIKRPKDIEDKFKLILKLREILNSNNKRKLISQIILRHIHGNDLDANAINIAKLNLWLEAIKLAPRDFQYDRLPSDTNHILPNLTINLSVGNSLVGLPNKEVLRFFKISNFAELTKLFELREKYILNPENIDIINEFDKIQSGIREKLGPKFEEFLINNGLPGIISDQTIPLSWVLEYWHCFLSEHLSEKSEEEYGFDIIVGNPPWGAKLDSIHEFLKYHFTDVVKGQYDSFNVFTYHNIRDLLKTKGTLNYIIPNELCLEEVNEPLRKYLLQYHILEITNLGLGIFDDVTKPSMVLRFEKRLKENDDQIQIFVGLPKDKKHNIKDDIIKLKEIIKNNCFSRNQEDFIKNDQFKFDIFSHPIDNEIKEVIRNNNFKPLKAYLSNGRGIDTNKSGTYFICPNCGVYNPPFGVGKALKNEKPCANQNCDFIFQKTQVREYESEDFILKLDYQEGEHHAPGYIGEDLQRFYFKRNPRLFRYYGDVVDEPEFFEYSYIMWKDHDLYTDEKLLWRKVSTGNLPQVMVYDGFLVTNQQIYIFKKNANVQHISIYFYLAILTSRLIHYYYLKEFGDPDKEVLPHFTQSKIKKFPIPLPDTEIDIYKDLINNTKQIIDQIAEFQEIPLKDFWDILSSKPYSITDTFEKFISLYAPNPTDKIYQFKGIQPNEIKNEYLFKENGEWLEVYSLKKKDNREILLFKIRFISKIIRTYIMEILKSSKIQQKKELWDRFKNIKIPRFIQSLKSNEKEISKLFNEYNSILERNCDLIEKIDETFSKMEENIFFLYNITDPKSRNRIIEIANANKFKIF